MRYYSANTPRWKWLTLPAQLLVFAGLSLAVAVAAHLLWWVANGTAGSLAPLREASHGLLHFTAMVSITLYTLAMLLIITATIIKVRASLKGRIRAAVFRSIGDPSLGNPLHLQEGQVLPRVACEETPAGFEVVISAFGITTESIEDAASAISSALSGKLSRFAVVKTISDAARNEVRCSIEDVTVCRRLTPSSVGELCDASPCLLQVQDGTGIDLTTSGHMLVAGRTRSGKTTAVISLLLQALSHGGDAIIIDPKSAELSTLPGAVAPDEDGGGRAVLDALRRFERTRRERQAILNQGQQETGDAVHWWEVALPVSLLFIDEYMTCRTLFPTRASKEEPDYCLRAFDDLLKSIVTQGASAGCYAIISVAQPSVGEGGIPSFMREACSTRILFKPSIADACLMWSAEEVKCVAERDFRAGDAWFTTTDGIHEAITFVQFPDMGLLKPYAELRRLLGKGSSEGGAGVL